MQIMQRKYSKWSNEASKVEPSYFEDQGSLHNVKLLDETLVFAERIY